MTLILHGCHVILTSLRRERMKALDLAEWIASEVDRIFADSFTDSVITPASSPASPASPDSPDSQLRCSHHHPSFPDSQLR